MEFQSLKTHCSEPYCNMLTYVPIQCSDCKNYFCQKHINSDQHKCKNSTNIKSFTCPRCSQLIKYNESDDVNAIFYSHETTECQAELMGIVIPPDNPDRCPVKGCKNVLNPVTEYKCTKCNKRCCMAHRFPNQHFCIYA